jgi:hypothetical protein
LIHDPPCDSYETKESKGKRVAAALVERKNFCPGVVLANYHFCGLIVESYRRLFPIYSPSRFFFGKPGIMGKIQDLRTTHQTTRRYKLLAIRNIETHDGYGYVLQSFMMVGACSSEQ